MIDFKNELRAKNAVQRLDFLKISGQEITFSQYLDAVVSDNTFFVDPDSLIYRIMDLDHLDEGISGSKYKIAQISKESWIDELENPWRDRLFTDATSPDEKISIDDMMSSYYGTSFTDAGEEQDVWDSFGKPGKSVRIATTPRKWISAQINEEDSYRALRYFALRVSYSPADEIRKWAGSIDIFDHLDSRGIGILASLTRIREDFKGESEIRMIYAHHQENKWAKENVTIVHHDGRTFANVPFKWKDVIAGIQVPKSMSDTDLARVESIAKKTSAHASVSVSTCNC